MTRLIHGKARKTASYFAGRMKGASNLNIAAFGGHGTGSNRLVRAGVLLEAILALLLIAMGIGAIGTLLRSTMQSVRQSQIRTRAMLLAESKLAELQAGLLDLTEQDSGDFDDRPPGFTWSMTVEPTITPELQLVSIDLNYENPTEQFTYSLRRLYSKSLNLSLEQMKQLSEDPSALNSLENTGLQELIGMLSEMPNYEQLVQMVMAGGISEMLQLYNQISSGKVSTSDILGMAGDLLGSPITGADETETLAAATLAYPEPWTDDETKEYKEYPELEGPAYAGGRPDISAGQPRPTGTEVASADRPGTRRRPSRDGETSEEIRHLANQPMGKDEAMEKMAEILRRMAEERER